jgi:hypothetical protein
MERKATTSDRSAEQRRVASDEYRSAMSAGLVGSRAGDERGPGQSAGRRSARAKCVRQCRIVPETV